MLAVAVPNTRAYAVNAIAFLLLCAAFSLLPILGSHKIHDDKDYSVWYAAGQVIRAGAALYPHTPGARLEYMYPPFAADVSSLVRTLIYDAPAPFNREIRA